MTPSGRSDSSKVGANTDPFHDPRLVNPNFGVATVWSDIGCPWASLALHTLEARIKDRDVDVLIDHRAFPLELFNSRATPKPIIDVEVTAIAGLVPSLGWRPWAGADAEYVVSTLPAMAAVQAAKEPAVGGLRASQQLDAALRQAFYAEGCCITIHARIMELAAGCSALSARELESALQSGQGYAAVFGQWHTARDLPVQGSPHVFVNDRYAEHNPGVDYHWTAAPGQGFPRFERYDPTWADDVIDAALG